MGTVLGVILLIIAAIIILLIVGKVLFEAFGWIFEFVIENWFIFLIIGLVAIIFIGTALIGA